MSCQAALARLEALESDNAGVEVVDLNGDECGTMDERRETPSNKLDTKTYAAVGQDRITYEEKKERE